MTLFKKRSFEFHGLLFCEQFINNYLVKQSTSGIPGALFLSALRAYTQGKIATKTTRHNGSQSGAAMNSFCGLLELPLRPLR